MSQLPFTRPTAIRVLLLTLTTILVVTSDQEFDYAYYKRLGPGYSYGYLQTPPTQQFSTVSSALECASIALNSQSEFITYNNVSHVCKNYSPKNLMTVVSTNDSNEISFYRNTQWIKVYALSMGAGSKVYDSFANKGSPSSWNVEKCIGTFCPNFFRHPILDVWSHLPIDEAKLVIYENQTAVVNMVFDGRNTTLESWFSLETLKSSPWPDLHQQPVNIFSLFGAAIRRFYVSSEYGGCVGDWGWMLIAEARHMCYYEQLSSYPQLLYSKRNSRTLWDSNQGKGDSIAIFIRLKPS
ncbi:uncharacterized protein LOC106872447 [Octopus bimaculoides]|uniref:Apple domain-containing protein n=1 Tax=Octopus bimaculoides TaxID=37653 RepID=A0A0L8H6T8_OCTBM|nr:uncharacterized protein LOC106872447 [Octopus bimaculoides]|eukprot:XP_014774936.1 PREDICTED: uncharacterized protein LOC106872447 [Octopus bimaculoides]